jgi:cytochrome c-type biogenesis protein CcmH/NrfF
MSTATESAAASAVKVAAVTGGALMTGMQSVSNSLGSTSQEIIWFITIAYGVLQIIKCMPWFTDQTIALWLGLRYGNWARWQRLAQRGEQSNDGGSDV